VGPRAGLDMCRKFCPPTGFDPRTIQPIAIFTAQINRPKSIKTVLPGA